MAKHYYTVWKVEFEGENSVMNVKKQYRQVMNNPMHEGTQQQIEQFLEQE